MKKFALGLLSVFMILGGVLLSACDKKISLSVSAEQVVIFTNDDQEENFQKKDIDVTVENSSAGANVEILKGNDSIRVSPVKHKTGSVFTFTIFGDKSGEAEIRVSAVEDNKQSKIINVQVNTILEQIKSKHDDNVDARTSLYVVKGVQKDLNVKDYFDFEPATANITDIVWSFEDSGNQEFVKDDILMAKIENGKLFVFEDFDLASVTLRASFVRNTNVYENVKFEVLENSTINNLVVDDKTLYQNNVAATKQVLFELKRNDANKSSVYGQIVVNSKYNINLEAVVYQKTSSGNKNFLSRDEYEKYFVFDITSKSVNESENKITYNFSIDALDTKNLNLFGEFYFYLRVGYQDYNFDITTEAVEVVVDTSYSATKIDITNADNDSLNNSIIDVFSNYETGNGFKIHTLILPDEVAIDNNMFFISVDLNQTNLRNFNLPEENPVSSFVNFYCRGELVTFVPSAPGSSVYVSSNFVNATDIYVSSGQEFDVLEGIDFKFVSVSNASANTSLTMNFYKISTEKNLDISDSEGNALESLRFMSSSASSSRTLEYTVKISDLSTISGLSLVSNGNGKFSFSKLELIDSNFGGSEGTYVVVKFSVFLNSYNFADSTKFWFEHVTGKKSSELSIEAFVPLQSAVIQNADKSSSDVYKDEQTVQSFVDNSGLIEIGQYSSTSVSRLMLEAGTYLPLNTNIQNATLGDKGTTYRFLSFDALKNAVRIVDGLTDEDEIEARAKEIFSENSLDLIANSYYRFFDVIDGTLFNIDQNKLVLQDNAFKGYVCAMFNGFNEQHENVSLVRFFALESFYSVRYLSSNVKTTLLYTTETLSLTDISRASIDVSISLRPDEKVPTYSNDVSYFDFYSVIETLVNKGSIYSNKYYDISDFSFGADRRTFKFRLTAKSTNLQTSVVDTLTIVYRDENGFKRETEIQIEIKNVKRIENVQWLNQTPDNEIYLNLTTTVSSERSFTISTSVQPSDANDIGLTHAYFATAGSAGDLSITTSSIGQTFNLNINTSTGGYGDLFLLPNDMVKIVDGVRQILVYKYSEDSEGKIVETPNFIKLSELDLYYDEIINGSENISNYFYNNVGDKVYYKDIIIKIGITIADGSSEGTAIRIYNEADLKDIDYAKYYKIMNNITLNGWNSYNQFNGMIFGKDETTTLRFENNSKTFVNELNGTIKNLTFVGQAFGSNDEISGFVANKNNGVIENVLIDVYYEDGEYKSSLLDTTSSSSVGMIAGLNYGTISNSYSYGATMMSRAAYVGGLVGQNFGSVVSSGVEFYMFSKKTADGVVEQSNTINVGGGGTFGGLVGFADGKSKIEKSYVYAYSLIGSNNDFGTIILNNPSSVGAFMGGYSEGALVNQSFAYLGNLKNPTNSPTNSTVTRFVNSYLTYKENGKNNIVVYRDIELAFVGGDYSTGNFANFDKLSDDDLPSKNADSMGSEKWQAQVAELSKANDIWEVENIDSEINFGFMHLKNNTQSAAVDISNVSVQDNTSPLKSLKAGGDKGVLFVYSPLVNVTDPTEKAQLDNLNTISIAELFGISNKQARSLLLSSDSKSISLTSNSLKVLNKNVESFEISVHLKMNFTQSKTFKFVILNYLPELKTMVDSAEIKENQTLLLQTNRSRSVVYTMTHTIYLNGKAYSTAKDDFAVEFDLTNSGVDSSEKYVSVSKSNNSLVMQGEKAHTNGSVSKLDSYVVVKDVQEDADFLEAIKNQRKRSFDVSVYNGATSLVVDNANNLVVDPSQFAVFDVSMTSDAQDDNLVVGLVHENIEIKGETNGENSVSFVVDSKLTLDVSWTKTSRNMGDSKFRVIAKIKDSQRHLIENEYDDLKIVLNAKSQENNDLYKKMIGLSVKTQNVEDIGIATYNIESRQIKNSVLYIRPADEITNTLMPSSDAVVAVTVSPAYAKMTHFTLTYSTASDGNVGTVSLSRLDYNTNYGYYVNTSSTSLITNGLRVNLTENDKKGNGVYYFRLYVSSAFAANSDLKLTLTYFYNDEVLISGNHNLSVSYLQNANIKVNGASTYMLAKGASATVSVTVGLNQRLYDLYLQNNGANINLTAPVEQVFDTYKVYTATLTANVDAVLEGKKGSGIFYVCAAVERVINNIQEIKVSRATVCLVDFSVDGNGIKVKSSGGTSNYNGKTYDVFYSYVNSTDVLNFDYPMVPEQYNYDKNNQSEVEAVERIMAARKSFETNNNYKDDEVGYYINYDYNELSGLYDKPLVLKQQLWYATNESVSSAIYNENYDQITQNDSFRIEENEDNNSLSITGKRTGRQLMKLQTKIMYQGIEFVYDYYFLIVVDIWSDEDTPTQIDSAEKFIDFATNSELPDDYILMSDIVLSEYTPLSTDLIKSLDGNGYTIHINSFKMPDSNALNLALFTTVNQNTTLKNIRVNLYNGGQIRVDVSKYTTVNIAGFALENNGVIYNCEVVSYYDAEYQSSTVAGENGLVVKYTMGQNTDPIDITTAMNIESFVSGFVGTNNSSIMNSRVGGQSFRHIIEIADVSYVKTQKLGHFVIEGQGEVAGFVNSNSSSGFVSACFASNLQIYNKMASTTSLTAGFVLKNANKIQNCYVEGSGPEEDSNGNVVIQKTDTNIKSLGIVAGFVYLNENLVKNSYSNIAIENSESKSSMVAGFVYRNEEDAEIKLCYSACLITKYDINQMQFSGVDDLANSLNFGKITSCYFYNQTLADDTNQTKMTNGALAINNVIDNEDGFYGFSFSSGEEAYDGIWKNTSTGISLVSANKIAISNRYAITTGTITNIFYNKTIIDADTMEMVDLSYGSEENPIIIRNAYDFAVATGKATTKEISAYKEYYNNNEVFGNYRIVNNIDMSEIDQNAENDNSVKLTTTSKTFKGLLDGNGFTISNINLGSSVICENYGLFAKLNGAVVMNLDFIVDSIHNSQANIVGTLAGTAVDTTILVVNLSPVEGQGTTVDNTSILGNNIVGGVVGMLLGESRLSDIYVKDIDIYSSYYNSGKFGNIHANSKYTGVNMREYVEIGQPLQSKVRELSYAGAIVGYVDIYSNLSSDFVKYYSSLDVSLFDIVTVHVADAVNIYGEVAGGLFGYVGNSTLIYDASIELNADMNRTHPSYIISKNLFSGGLIGENYGGLFAVSASYESVLQKTIEDAENGYYGGDLSAEKGQETIFSYTEQDEGFTSNINDPMFIGGLVGYMGGGYIYIGLNKLNVISQSARTVAVGGLVGMAGYSQNQFDLTMLSTIPKANIFLNEVYASGNVYNKNGVSAGLIGGIESANDGTSVVALKNALAVNYYSYNGTKLDGYYDKQNKLQMYILVGNIYKSVDLSIVENLTENLYMINSEDYFFNVLDGQTTTLGSKTVGGYSTIKLGTGDDKVELKPFAFNVVGYDHAEIYKELLQPEHIGTSSMSSPSAAYAKMYNYFLANGWSDKYWMHTEQRLFPHIQLLPKLDIQYLDVDNAGDVLRAMNNSAITVVVRGLVSNTGDDIAYSDVDLREKLKTPIVGFRGKLISYYDFMKSDDQGRITEGKALTANNKIIGGTAGDRAGLIISRSMFESLEPSVTIEGLNIYFYNENINDSNYSFVQGDVKNAIFRNCNFVLNNDKKIKTQEETNVENNNENVFSAGLIARVSQATSIVKVNLTFRNDAKLTFAHDDSNKDDVIVSMGGLVGYMIQNTGKTSIGIEQITIVNQIFTNQKYENDEENPVNVEFVINDKVKKFYGGIFAGVVSKHNGAKVSLGLSVLGNVNLRLSNSSNQNSNRTAENEEDKEFYIGGYAGRVDNIDSVYMIGLREDEKVKNSNINIYLTCDIGKLFAGLGFGSIENSSLVIENDEEKQTGIEGGIYQVGDIKIKQVNIGGIAGFTNSNIEIKGFVVTLNVAKMIQKQDTSGGQTEGGKLTETAPDYTDGEETIFDKNLYDYSEKLSPFTTYGSADDSIGGFIGRSSVSVKITGNCSISGTIDVEISTGQTRDITIRPISIGGMIGKTIGSVETRVSSSNNMNISVRGIPETSSTARTDTNAIRTEAYVGGIIGFVQATSQTDQANNYTIVLNESASTARANFSGNVISSVGSIKFGGAVGYITRQDYGTASKRIAISNVVFGGALKVYGDTIANGNVSVGGVVGEFLTPSQSVTQLNDPKYVISQCFSYGDVFVIYKYQDEESKALNHKLASYNFGGIVGKASQIAVRSSYSLMTSFNNRLSAGTGNNGNSTLGEYNVGAIVGGNSSVVTFVESSPNYYSSGVCLTYQMEDTREEGRNIDVAYTRTAQSSRYSGYAGKVTVANSAGSSDANKITEDLQNEHNMLHLVRDYVSDSFTEGHKLNPYKWEEKDRSKMISTMAESEFERKTDKEKFSNITGKYHNITWVALVQNLNSTNSIENPIADNLTNIAFVGNGHVLGRDDSFSNDLNPGEGKTAEDPKILGGLVNSMGKEYAAETDTSSESNPNFNVVSGLILEMNINVDINVNDEKSYSYGGVVGEMTGNSFLYGIGVKGDLSVGGGNHALRLGGLVGQMKYGMIDNCYVDADITYRANDNGIVSGIANLSDRNTTIKSTYSSGLIETYLDNDVYALANSTTSTTDDSVQTSNDLLDCYSISQIKRTDISGTVSANSDKNYFISGLTYPVTNADDSISTTTDGGKINVIGNVYNGCYEARPEYKTSNNPAKFPLKEIGVMSLPYNAEDDLIKGQNSILVEESNPSTTDIWYFSPYINYGYAAHGFGYLKNVTTYTRTPKEPATAQNTTSEVSDTQGETNPSSVAIEKSQYDYAPLTYADILTQQYGAAINGNENGWFLGVPNLGKFEQMIDSVSIENNKPVYSKDFKFVLRYGFDMSKIAETAIAKNIGGAEKGLIIDGNNNVLDFSKKTGLTNALFGTVVGDIENLSLHNINVSGGTGTLAKAMTGNLKNVTVTGNLTSSASGSIGGVVGTLTGTANNVDSVVNVTVTGSAAITGGVIGSLTGDGHYLSNNGIVLNKSENISAIITDTVGGEAIGLQLKIEEKNNSDKLVDVSVNSITGGIVGRMNDGAITNSFNANAVLDRYTNDKSVTCLAGGIVGYAGGTKIQDCYNTGLVGAGNYSSASYSFAGGIFAYGKGAVVSGCINDGPVEAIGKKPDGTNDYSISVTQNSGSNEIDEYTNSPAELVYDVVMTYNPDSDRMVNAFGIGFNGKEGESGKIEGCSSSTANIKNDGNIGETKITKQLIFDRNRMLDNKGLVKNYFYGKFALQASVENKEMKAQEKTKYGNIKTKGYVVNGYDAYGFPSRIYAKDQISRSYGKPDAETFVGNDISDAERSGLAGYDDSKGLRQYNGVFNFGLSKEEGIEKYKYSQSQAAVKDKKEVDNNIFDNNKRYYFLEQTSEYYSSSSFDGYGNILANLSDIIAYDCQSKQEYKSDKKSVRETIEEKIAEIEQKKESDKGLKKFTINGKLSSVVYSSDNLKSVYGAVKYTVSTSFNLSDLEVDSLSARSFTLSGVSVGNVVVNPQFYSFNYSVTKNEDNSHTVYVDYTLFFAKKLEGAGKLKVNISYTSTPKEISLGKNNVVVDNDGKTCIILKDKKGINFLSESMVENIRQEKIGDTRMTVSLKLGGRDISISKDNFKFGDIGDSKNVAYIVYSNFNNEALIKDLDGKKLSLTLSTFKDELGYSSVDLTTRKYNFKFDVDSLGIDPVTAIFEGYEETTLQGKNFLDTNFGDIQVDGKIGKRVSLSKIGDVKKAVFGDYNFAVVKFENDAWSISSQNVNCGYEFSVSGDYLQIFMKNVEGVENPGEILNSFITDTVLKFKLYYADDLAKRSNDIVYIEKSAKSYDNERNIILDTVFKSSNVGNFNNDGTYYLSLEEFEKASGAGIVDKTVNFLGMTFHVKEVTYNYTFKEGFLRTDNTTLGYEFKFYESGSNSVKYIKQGAFVGNGTDDQKSYKFSSLNIGDRIEGTYNLNRYKEQGDGASESADLNNNTSFKISTNELILKVKNDKENDFYTISIGKEKNPINEKEESYVKTSYNTKRENLAARTQYSYIYTIYESGDICVEYIYGGLKDIDFENTTKYSRRYMASAEGELYYSTCKRLIDEAIKDDDNPNGVYYEWNPKKLSGDEETFGFEVFDFHKIGTIANKAITVDVIASFCGEKNIVISRNNNGVVFEVETKKITVDELPKKVCEYDLYSQLNSSFNIDDIKSEDPSFVGESFEYKLNDEWIPSKQIVANDFGPTTYNYVYKKMVRNQSDAIQEEDSNSNPETFENIVLGEDIHLGKEQIGDNDKNMFGNGRFVSFISKEKGKISLFVDNTGIVKNLCVVGIVSMEDEDNTGGTSTTTLSEENTTTNTPTSYSLFANSSLTLIDLKIFGNIRNINALLGANNVVKPVVAGNIELKNVNAVESSVSITGLNASMQNTGDGFDVSTIITDDLISDTDKTQDEIMKGYSSKNIIVSGSGGNGRDGVVTEVTNSSMNGENGGKGGKGGNVNLNPKSFQGFVRLGAGGFGGNGENGKHGKFDEASDHSLGGGAAGKKDENGTEGEIKETIALNTNASETKKFEKLTSQKFECKQMNGNGGIGGFGRIDPDSNIYYTSAGSGTEGTQGADGKNAGTWKTTPDGEAGTVFFGATRNMNVSENAGHMYPNEGWGYKADPWMDNVKAEVENNNTMQETSGSGTANSQLYVCIKLAQHRTTVWWNIVVDSYARVIWCSGESINSVGSCSYSG